MHPVAALHEAFRLLRRERAFTVAISFTVLVMVVAIVATAGIAAANRAAVVARLDNPSSRLISIDDVDGKAGLTSETVQLVQHLSGTAWVIGLGPINDVRNANFLAGQPVPFRIITGEASAVGIPVAEGAVASTRAGFNLGFVDGVGSVADGFGRSEDVAQLFDPPSWVSSLQNVVVRPTGNSGQPVIRILVQADALRSVPSLLYSLSRVVSSSNPQSLRITGPDGLAGLLAGVTGDLDNSSRLTVIGVALAGALGIMGSLVSLLNARRIDFGRRRALGARRMDIVTILVCQTFLIAAPTSLVGVSTSWLVLINRVGYAPPAAFGVSLLVVVMLVVVSSALLTSLALAYRDPVRILRQP